MYRVVNSIRKYSTLLAGIGLAGLIACNQRVDIPLRVQPNHQPVFVTRKVGKVDIMLRQQGRPFWYGLNVVQTREGLCVEERDREPPYVGTKRIVRTVGDLAHELSKEYPKGYELYALEPRSRLEYNGNPITCLVIPEEPNEEEIVEMHPIMRGLSTFLEDLGPLLN